MLRYFRILKNGITFSISVATLLPTPISRAEFIVHSWEDRFPQSSFGMNLNSNYLFTSSNFDSGGNIIFPSGLSSYAKLQTDLNLDFRVNDRLGVFGRSSWQYVNLISDSKGGTGFGFGDQTAGLVFRILGIGPDASLSIDLQGQVDIPGYSNLTSFANATPYMGDGSIDFAGGIFMGVPLFENRKYKLQTVFGAGYIHRTEGFSAALPWSAFLKLVPQLSGFTAEAGANGILSLQTDYSLSYSTPHSNLVSGGSYITGAVAPSLIQASIKSGYRFTEESQVDLIGKLNIWGQNVPTGYSVSLRLQYLFGKLKEGHIEKQLRSQAPTEQDPTGNDHPTFTTYSMDANIVKTNDRLNLVKINKGSQDGIDKGQIFDIFNIKVSSQVGEAIARAQVTSVKVEEAALEIIEFYKEVSIEEGFIAKRLIQ
ncbi:MAG: hypothetical protein ABIQ95_00840 [Bdellovibrionia bacterium]